MENIKKVVIRTDADSILGYLDEAGTCLLDIDGNDIIELQDYNLIDVNILIVWIWIETYVVLAEEIFVKKIAVFGNAGGGKSTLSKRLAQITDLPLIPLDLIKYKVGGGEVTHEEYKKAHAQILQQKQWIVDGFGSLDTVWERLEVADTLVYIDMPIILHYWWVTKRFLKGLFFLPPEGWPDDSPLWKGSKQLKFL